jgi:hypothetical protein
MAFYRKKPVVIEARQFTPSAPLQPLADWCGGHVGWIDRYTPAIEIGTLEGVMRAELGDWIIKGVQGEFYPCKPDIFEATYEPATVEA